MPVIQHSNYEASFPFRWTHFNTIYPALFRSSKNINYKREEIKTIDNDILYLDWLKNGHKRLVICLHGLEGTSTRPYIEGMMSRFQASHWDGLALNFRSCAGEINKQVRSYNMGATADLHFLINKIIAKENYHSIVLIGFSLGGNLLLKYMGEGANYLPKTIKAAVALSVPCYIPTANIKIAQFENRAYLKRFMGTLNEKIQEKKVLFPAYFAPEKRKAKNFQEFDEQFTAPIHGYSNAMDYWESCSSLHFLPNIKRPTLIINALDDTFLSTECYPYEAAKNNNFLFLETPKHGGHCGFYTKNKNGYYWSEDRALSFVETVLK